MLSYTSGTTGGDPKGVKLTHKMSMAAGYAINIRMGDSPLCDEDSYISYLPSSHVFEQVIFGMSIVYGFKCGFFCGNTAKLKEDCQALRPTTFPSVPKLYNKFYSIIQGQFKN